MSGPAPHSSFAVVREVAVREFLGRVATRAFLAVTAGLVLAGVLAILVASVVAGSGGSAPQRVGVVGGDPSLPAALAGAGERASQPVRAEPVPDSAAAREGVASGTWDAALVAEPGGGYTVVTESGIDGEFRPVLEAAVERAALESTLARQGLAPESVLDRTGSATLTSAPLDPPPPDALERTLVAYIAVMLLFFTTFFYGLNVAIGVVEEKASRVVELLLSTIKPLDLLVGKVLGIGAVGFVQLFLVGGATLATATAVGLLGIGATALAVFVIGLVFYVLGFLFFAVLYAAVGSLVSRQEDVNGVSMPVTLLSFAAFFAAQYSITNPGNAVVAVLQWIPPLSSTLIPVRYAQGDVSLVAVVVAVVVTAAATAGAAVLAARVYERSVLGSGGSQSLVRALRGGSAPGRADAGRPTG